MNKWVNFLWPLLLLGALLILRTYIQSPQGSRGARLYQQQCQNCHMEAGQGLGQLIPPLAGSDYLIRYPERVPCIIRYGQEGVVEVNGILYDQPMPENSSLSNEDIYHLMKFLYTSWNNEKKEFSRKEVEDFLDSCIEP